jgi:glycerophosphoryl diester phosphodiesterase
MAAAVWPYSRWIAHRGASKLAPENTLAAFRLGAHHGYRMFECDAKLSADGIPFLLHDPTLDRTTNGHGIAGDRTWHDLSLLDAGAWHSVAYAGEPIPTLESVARYCLANKFFLNIEIKPTPGSERLTGEVVAQEALRLWAGHVPPLLTSFKTAALEGAVAVAPGLPRGLLLDTLPADWLETAMALDCAAVVCNHVRLDASTVVQAHQAGMKCLSYTVNDELTAQRLTALGIDGIITDRVDLFTPV